VRKPKDM